MNVTLKPEQEERLRALSLLREEIESTEARVEALHNRKVALYAELRASGVPATVVGRAMGVSGEAVAQALTRAGKRAAC